MDKRDLKKLIDELAENSKPAYKILFQLAQSYGEEPIIIIRKLGIRGVEIAILWEDGDSYDKTIPIASVYGLLKRGLAMKKLRASRKSAFWSGYKGENVPY